MHLLTLRIGHCVEVVAAEDQAHRLILTAVLVVLAAAEAGHKAAAILHLQAQAVSVVVAAALIVLTLKHMVVRVVLAVAVAALKFQARHRSGDPVGMAVAAVLVNEVIVQHQ